jgi:hypothetical protein
MRTSSALLLAGVFTTSVALHAAAPRGFVRSVPRPLDTHPGNVFLAGERVTVPIPASDPAGWRLFDYDERASAEAKPAGTTVELGVLPAGFYRLRPANAVAGTNWISLAVLPALKAPTPLSSPIGLDVAMAWFYAPDQMDAVASLCALAGVNWVRDRLRWDEMEPQRGQFAGPGKYDAAATAQTRAGLQVLQVIHLSPPWANPDTKRFPLDLRDGFRFYREMARRWPGQVLAFEPWNEPDIDVFGGHTGAEIASLQKAAWLGMKGGNPKMQVPLAVFALHNENQLADLRANEAWPYFDTFNLHHYEPFENYPKVYADFRAVSAGRPLWTTEAALPVRWSDEATKEPTDADLRVQAERVAKTYACALHEGTLLFYFLLPHYVEGPTQFGILRADLTPRPAYVALAAVGRLLAGAQPLGRIAGTGSQQAYLFRAKPDGRTGELLVAWDAKGSSRLQLPQTPEAVFDHLGRERPVARELDLTAAPVFVRLPKGTDSRLALTPPPPPPTRLKGKPSPIVLQSLWPADQTDLKESAYRVRAGQRTTVPVFVYNLGGKSARGRLQIEAPAGWTVEAAHDVELPPEARQELPLVITAPGGKEGSVGTLRVTGEFGPAGRAVLSVRLLLQP